MCPACKRPSQTPGEQFCPHDGAILIDAVELTNAHNDPLLGRRIESFAIVARLGEGGMGTVYRAIQVGMDREVALKILRSDLAHDGKVVQRFHQEARAAARLSHRNLATVFTSGSTSDGVYYIAMEHLDGPPLEHVIAAAWQSRNHIPTYTLERPRAMRLWCQIVAALAHAHRLGIVHRAQGAGVAAMASIDHAVAEESQRKRRTESLSNHVRTDSSPCVTQSRCAAVRVLRTTPAGSPLASLSTAVLTPATHSGRSSTPSTVCGAFL